MNGGQCGPMRSYKWLNQTSKFVDYYANWFAWKLTVESLNQMRQNFSKSWIKYDFLAEVCKASLIPQNSDERFAW